MVLQYSNREDTSVLRQALEDRARFFELAMDLFCIASADGLFLELSPSWASVLGYPCEELRGQPFLRFIHPDDHEATVRATADLGRGESLTSFTNRYRCKDGSWIQLEWSASALPQRGLIFAVARDVTRREQAETSMRVAHERLRHILNSSGVVLFASELGDGARFTYISENVRQAYGYDADRFLDDAAFWRSCVHPQDLARVDAESERLAQVERQTFEYRFRRGDGKFRWVHADVRVVRGEEGEVAEVVGTWQDITERKHAEELIQQQARALMELSTPLIPITDEILVMPLIGMVDSRRAAQVLDTLLNGIADRGAAVAILDITGVGVVDTKVADTLLRSARAVQLLGAEVVLTGIRPDVAQTLVGLGADLGGIITCATLQAGIRHAMRRITATSAEGRAHRLAG